MLQIVESPTRNSRAFLRLQKSKIRAINTHSQQHPSRRSGERSDSRRRNHNKTPSIFQSANKVHLLSDSPPLRAPRHPLRGAPTSNCRKPESNDSGFFTSAEK